jgi:hypothetical protein
MMIDRRTMMLTGLTGCLWSGLCPSIARGCHSKEIVRQCTPVNDGLVQGCVFAKSTNVSGLEFANVKADYWTGRVSSFDDVVIPSSMGRGVVWDDIFWHRSVRRTVEEILNTISRYHFEPDDCVGSYRFHLDGLSSPQETLLSLLDNYSETEVRKIAIIDLQSTGLTTLDWTDLIPSLIAHYDIVVGIAHIFDCHAPEDNPDLTLDFYLPSCVGAAAKHCDALLVTSDALMGASDILSCAVRGFHFCRILEAISAMLVKRTFGAIASVFPSGTAFAISSSTSIHQLP